MWWNKKDIHHKTEDKSKAGTGEIFDENRVFDSYCDLVPTHQNAIDLLPGWNSSFPPENDLRAGDVTLYKDGRIHDAVAAVGSIEGAKVLEIGPLEGLHTHILNSYRPALIDSIEANKRNFLKCLVTKEILKLNLANFYLGDAVKWLDNTSTHYDLAIASGVLYHMADPGHFLVSLLGKCDSLYIWTHYYDDALLAENDPRVGAFTGTVIERDIGGRVVRYVERRYHETNASNKFCGGMQDVHYWMFRSDIIALIEAEGFGDIAFSMEDPDHPGGPSFSLFCRRLVRTETV